MKIIIGYILLALIILGGGYYFINNKDTNEVNDHPEVIGILPSYRNEDYSFYVTLPKSWAGYSVLENKWDGGSEVGPLISIRHPEWATSSPRQDIPIMVFTLKQWDDMQADKFHIGAAPINPSELSRNRDFVFALPARYNFSYLTGYEEVDLLLTSGAVKAY